LRSIVLRLLVPLLLWLPLASPSPATRLLMKDGTVYILKEPPQFSGGRIVFTTVDGRVLSAKQDDVQSIGAVIKPTPTPRYSSQDSRALGAIARQQRDKEGKTAEVAPRPTRRDTVTPKKASRRTPTPRPTPRPKS
jgi:hypothetical protein